MPLVRNVLVCSVLAFVGALPAPIGAADSAIVVAVQSGRKFAGDMDAASSAEQFGGSSSSPIVTSDGTNSGSALIWIVQAADSTGAGAQLLACAERCVHISPLLFP